MHQSNLLALFRRFSPEEWKSFGKYLASPYHNSNKRLPVLFDYLAKYHPALDHPKLERQKAWQAVFGAAAAYDDAVLRVLLSAMSRAAEQFLAEEQFRKNKPLQSRLLAAGFSEHQLYPRFVQTAKTALESIDSQPVKRMEDLLNAFLLESELHFHPETSGLTTDDHHLRSAIQRLDEFYALAKLRLSVELSARASLMQETAEYPLLQPLREMLRDIAVAENPGLRLYLDLLDINLEGLTEGRFFGLKSSFLEQHDRLDGQVKLEVFIHLLNFANRLTANDNVLFYRELFELNQFGAATGLFLVNGAVPDAWFVNACVTGAVCKEWDWTESFIQTHSPQLCPEVAKDATALSQAFLLFHQNRFNAAYDLLSSVPNNDAGYTLRRRMLGLRCLFETALEKADFRELLEAQLAAFEKYLARQKVYSRERIAAELNFCKVLQKMLPLLAPAIDFKEQLGKVRRLLEPQTPVSGRGWLLEKIAAFELKHGDFQNHHVL